MEVIKFRIMKKNIIYLLIIIFLGGFGMTYVLSSKTRPPTSSFDCSQANNENVQIQINFSSESNGPMGFTKSRDDFYQGYIPTPDLRWGSNISNSAAGSLIEQTKYYCVVTVTSPQCQDWQWTRVMDETNATSNGLMDIEVLGDGADTFLEVTYFEVLSGSGGEPQFNTLDNTRLRYHFSFEYFGGLGSSNVPQPIFLDYTYQVDEFGDYAGNSY